jgi:hypothetical protein
MYDDHERALDPQQRNEN